MTGRVWEPLIREPASGRRWHAHEHRIEVRGVSNRLRLVSFAAGWLASVDTVDGPTLGYDHSPYLAVSAALEPIGGSIMEALTILAAARVDHRSSTGGPVSRKAALDAHEPSRPLLRGQH